MERDQISNKFPFGASLPEFSLTGTDGKIFNSQSLAGAPASLIVFTCNHCPYVKGSEGALIELANQFIPRGLKVVTISSNDPIQYPEDGFEKMKEKALTMKLPYPYLFDETQAIAKKFDAACTPECYLFDKNLKLVFHGTINDSPRDSTKATKHYLATALEQILSGEVPSPRFVHPIGCSIKWK